MAPFVTQRPTVTLYGKPGCHLCDDAKALLETVARTHPLSVRKVDITTIPALFEQYRYRIPVIEVDGGPVLDWPTTPERIRRAIQAAASAQ
jgi:glutaredoxin